MSGRMQEQLYDLAVAERWHLFPLVPGTKRPAVMDWEHAAGVPMRVGTGMAGIGGDAMREALADFLWPRRDSGIACGPSGLVVIDLDTALEGGPDGIKGLARVACEHGQDIPGTRTIRTRSGGWQLVYQAIPGREIRNSAGRIAPHVDVRGCGGYVVAPGSYVAADHKPGGWYVMADPRPPVPLPRWLADLASPPPRLATGQAGGVSGACGQAGGGSARRRLEGVLRHVLKAQVGERNHKLHWGACRAAEMAAQGLVRSDAARALLEGAGIRLGLSEAEALRTVASAFRRTP